MHQIKRGSRLSIGVLCGLLGGLVASCGESSDPVRADAHASSSVSSEGYGSSVEAQAPAPSAAAASTASPTSSRQACYLAVDGRVHVDGPCLVFPFGDGGYTLNAWSDGKPAQSHFAVVTTNGDGTATATWNADPDDTRAGDPLGAARFSEGCWVNDRVKICASER